MACSRTAGAVACVLLLSSVSWAKIVMLGDSYSDDGHGANLVVNTALSTDQMDVGIYPPAPYYQGHFSNGPTWIEVAAAALGQRLTDLATGNAATGSVPGAFTVLPYFGYLQTSTMVPVPSSLQQAQAYVALHGGSINPEDSYVVYIGINDLVYTVNGVAQATPDGIVEYINRTMSTLYDGGARQFVVVDIPPVAQLPVFSTLFASPKASSSAQNSLRGMVPQVNSRIATLVSDFPNSYPEAKVSSFSSNALFVNVTSNLGAYGFTDASTPCYMGPSFFGDITGEYNYTMCSNPTEHVYWDNVHPTKAFHAIFGQTFVAQLGEQLTANMPSQLSATA